VIAATKGHFVTLCEQSDHLGGNVIPGTKPPYKSEMLAVINYLSYMLEKNHVSVKLKEKMDIENIKSEKPDIVIVASGSLPIVPGIPGVDQDYVVSAEDVLLGNKTLGSKIAVIGGGSVGVETAEFLEEQGKAVTVIEMADEILADVTPVMKGSLLYRINSSTIQVLTGQKVKEIKDHKVVTDKQALDAVEHVVMAVGYKANNDLTKQLQENGIEFKVIGDAVKPRKIYHAVKEGFEAAYIL
jgi:pyruvate/2-oxoglutarate dehydrogenase complex dihydrolipoamide dehydrogenase (E3) component